MFIVFEKFFSFIDYIFTIIQSYFKTSKEVIANQEMSIDDCPTEGSDEVEKARVRKRVGGWESDGMCTVM